MDGNSNATSERGVEILNWEDGPTFEQYDSEYGIEGRLHRLRKRRKLEEELADYEFEGMEDDLEWLHYTN